MYLYIYLSIYLSISLSLLVYIYMYMYLSISLSLSVYIYTFIYMTFAGNGLVANSIASDCLEGTLLEGWYKPVLMIISGKPATIQLPHRLPPNINKEVGL